MKVPTLIGRKYVIGNSRPIMAPMPVSDETGVIIPANICAGSTVRMAVPNSAAICVRVKAEITMP